MKVVDMLKALSVVVCVAVASSAYAQSSDAAAATDAVPATGVAFGLPVAGLLPPQAADNASATNQMTDRFMFKSCRKTREK